MEKLTENTKMLFFDRTERSESWYDFSNVMVCYSGVHFEMSSTYSREESTYSLVVIGKCDESCKKTYHKEDLLLSVLLEQMIEDTESQIRIFLDFPKLAHDFLEKGIFSESSLIYRSTKVSPGDDLSVPVITRP